MKLKWISLLAVLVLLIPASLRADVHDNAQIFSQQAVDDATRDMKTMERTHNKQLVIETFAAVPDDQKDAAKQDASAFFKKWMGARAKELKVNGVYVLICMDPKHLEVGAGKNTIARGDFTEQDVDGLRKQMQAALHDKDYDKALSGAVETVEHAYSDNIQSPARSSAPTRTETEYSNGGYHTTYNSTAVSPGVSSGLGITFGSLLCMIVGGVIIVSLIRSVFRGGSPGGFGGGGGGYYPPSNQGYTGGNFGGNAGGNYGGGGYGGGGGSGFGKGFLGGLLGGAIGGYAADKFDHRNDQSNSGFFGGGGGQSDNSGNFGGGGGGGSSSFDSGPSDAGQGFSDSSSGGDFGSSGGGGDSGGGGGDGGGSSGGDF